MSSSSGSGSQVPPPASRQPLFQFCMQCGCNRCSQVPGFCVRCFCNHCSQARKYGFCEKCQCEDCTVDVVDDAIGDPTYDPADSDEGGHGKGLGKRKSNSATDSTPSKRFRVKTGSHSTQASAKARANIAALEATNLIVPSTIKRFCLVTLGHSEADCLENCHIVPRALDPATHAKLEYVWGLPYLGLSLDTRYNMVTLNATLHGAFDKGCWAFVPLDLHFLQALNLFFKDTPLQQMEPDVNRITKHYNGTTSFNYALLPFTSENGMKIPLIRRNSLTDEVSTIISYPYLDLPVLKSHIQPHFVVFNLISKFLKNKISLVDPLFEDLSVKHLQLMDCIMQSKTLYELWISAQPPDTSTGDHHSSNGGPDLEGNGSAGPSDTSRHHGTRSTRSKRTAQGNTPGGSATTPTNTSGPTDNELYPDDSLTAILNAKTGTDTDYGSDDDDDDADNEQVDEESDSDFYARLNDWLSKTTSGLAPPNNSWTSSYPNLTGPEVEPEVKRGGSDSGSMTTLVGTVVNSKCRTEALEMVHVMSV